MLDELRFSTSDAAVFRNATMILMSGVGRSKPSIAHDLGCSIGTVDNVRKHYRHAEHSTADGNVSTPSSNWLWQCGQRMRISAPKRANTYWDQWQ